MTEADWDKIAQQIKREEVFPKGLPQMLERKAKLEAILAAPEAQKDQFSARVIGMRLARVAALIDAESVHAQDTSVAYHQPLQDAQPEPIETEPAGEAIPIAQQDPEKPELKPVDHPETAPEWTQIPIADVLEDGPIVKVLSGASINTLGDLAAFLKDHDAIEIKGIGAASARKIDAIVDEYDLFSVKQQ